MKTFDWRDALTAGVGNKTYYEHPVVIVNGIRYELPHIACYNPNYLDQTPPHVKILWDDGREERIEGEQAVRFNNAWQANRRGPRNRSARAVRAVDWLKENDHMKNLAAFEATVQLSDGVNLPVSIAVVNRQYVVEPIHGGERYHYIMQQEPVMAQVRAIVAQKVGHHGQQDVKIEPTFGDVLPSQFLPSIAQNNAGAPVLQLVKGAMYSLVVWLGTANNKNIEIQPMQAGDTEESVEREWVRSGITVLYVAQFVGMGQTIVMAGS